MPQSRSSAVRRLGGVLVAIALLAACGQGAGPSASPAASGFSGPRPSSPAVVGVSQPLAGSALTGDSVHIVLTLTGAKIVTTTTTAIRPDEGHLHLYVDNVLVTMNYGLEQDIAVHPGTYVIKAEFVAGDHGPFSPRIWSPEVFFTVK
jgi:hypothetical protein